MPDVPAVAPQAVAVGAEAATVEVVAALGPQSIVVIAELEVTSEYIVPDEIQMKLGNTRPYLDIKVTDKAGVAINITGATLLFRIRRRGKTAILVSRTCPIINGVTGEAQFQWVAADYNVGVIDAVGYYDGELQITFSDGTVGGPYPFYSIHFNAQIG